ncbi:MAG: TetR/AcrR family transcriptional regulator [Candidatus Marinimicrobia bacterium]|nr:TetR/AcrR family transcriptional regulator [Candidatus Neomarinimicrobiota bacterium]MCF7904181.1 TetR/AcrR family transcriptional regulator [Candidatus Neomarinimicrobiota bacterium]
MTSSRKEQERQARKDAIIQATLRVFKAKGIEATTMDEIAAEADFGRASLYYYFASREELFSHIFESGWIKLWDSIDENKDESLDPRARFLGIVKQVGNVVLEDRQLYTFLFSAPNVKLGNQSWKMYQDKLYMLLRSILEEGVKTGDFPDIHPGMLMRAVGGIFHGLLFLKEGKQAVESKDVEALVQKVLEITPHSTS